MTQDQLTKEFDLARQRMVAQINKMGNYYITKWRSEEKLNEMLRVFRDTGNLIISGVDPYEIKMIDPRIVTHEEYER